MYLNPRLCTGKFNRTEVKIGKQPIKDGMARIVTEKKQVTAYIPLDDESLSALTSGPTGDLAFIVGASGKPLTKDSFGNYFREACRAAGIAKSTHGLGKLAALLDAEAGWTESELKSKFGWTDSQMPSLYTREANREKAALNAARRTRSSG